MNIRHDLRRKARSAVSKAVKAGRITPAQSCELCGDSDNIVGHHWAGWDEPNWLNVWWICKRCNTRLRGFHDGSISKEQARDFEQNHGGEYSKKIES